MNTEGRPPNVLSSLVWPESKYTRSTNIEIDNKQAELIPDFKFSSKSLRLLQDILDGSKGALRDRAWSIIGPYGSGKSTFLLFLIHLLGGNSSEWLDRCLVQLRLSNPEIENEVTREIIQQNAHYLPIIVQGSRSPLDLALCKSLYKAATNKHSDTSWVPPSFLSSLKLTINTLETGTNDSLSTVELFRQAENLAKIAGYRGLLVEIDEFGKFLERARWQGDLPDLITAQYLAELASSSSESQILFLVALHQGFQQYASSLSKQQSVEWTKIQGRFRQIDFNEEPENMYGLVAASLRVNGETGQIRNALREWASRVWSQVKEIPAFKDPSRVNYWNEILPKIYPLHPITLYALPRLSAYLGQFERTLFSFLASNDPLGLKSFLRKTESTLEHLPSLTIDYLYDYFIAGSRFSWLPIDIQKKVAEIESALERLGDRPPLESRILKTIGIINLLKTGSMLPTSLDVIGAALDCCDEKSLMLLDESIKRLEARKIIVFKKFAQEYRIWRGTDFDFELAREKAKEEILQRFNLTKFVNLVCEQRPLLVRRHSFERGTSRFFDVKIISAEDLLELNINCLFQESAHSGFDGILLYTIPASVEEISQLKRFASKVTDNRIIVVIPKEPVNIKSLVIDLASLQRIPSDSPEIRDDDVALKELASQIESTQDFLSDSVSEIFEPSSCQADWYLNGTIQMISNVKDMHILLSDICDRVYYKAPWINNELINREKLSASVVVAVKKILSRLLEETNKPDLGFSGNGPETSIFTTVLKEQGIYKQNEKGQWHLHKSNQNLKGGLKEVWDEIERFIQSTDSRSLKDLESLLILPPYGLRRGLISLIIWTVLIYHRNELSLYEAGTFVRDWTVEIFDLYLRSPASFKVRWLLCSGNEGILLSRLTRVIPHSKTDVTFSESLPISQFLTILYDWYKDLPEFTKNTERVSETSLRFRNTLLRISDPIELIFELIPSVLKLDDKKNNDDEGQVRYYSYYVRRFKKVVNELDSAYSKLIHEIMEYITKLLGIAPSMGLIKHYFDELDQEFIDHVRDVDTKAFILRARQPLEDDVKWIESIVSVLSGQPPRFWIDKEINEFKERFSVVVLSLDDAWKRYYARNLTEEKSRELKRLILEDRNSVLFEYYYQDKEISDSIDRVSKSMIEKLNIESSDLSRKSKYLIVFKMLESMTKKEDNDR